MAVPLGCDGCVASGWAKVATSRRVPPSGEELWRPSRAASGRQLTESGGGGRNACSRFGGAEGLRRRDGAARTSDGVRAELWEGCRPAVVSTSGQITAAAKGNFTDTTVGLSPAHVFIFGQQFSCRKYPAGGALFLGCPKTILTLLSFWQLLKTFFGL